LDRALRKSLVHAVHKLNDGTILAVDDTVHFGLADHVLYSCLAKEFQKLSPVVFFDTKRDAVVKAMHLHVLIVVTRVDLGH
jgi:hypothetical protein